MISTCIKISTRTLNLTPVRPEAVAAYVGKMGKSVDDHVKIIKKLKRASS